MEVLGEGQVMDGTPQTPIRMGSTPGTPLQQISPERLNQRIQNSPSHSLSLDHSGRKQSHRLSDASEVKARVAYLNAIAGSPTRGSSPTKPYNQSASHAAIQRAVVGREEAEAALNAMTAQLESARARERLVAERVESLMEQLQDARNRQRHERQVYEKEMKTSKKNEYKAELAVIKLQEELKELKNELESHRARAEHDKNEKEKARQEAFERAYAIAGMTEELQTLKDQLQVVEQERDQAVATAASQMQPEIKHITGSQIEAVKDDDSTLGKRKRPMPDVEPAPTPVFIDDMDLNDENCSIETKYTALQREVKYLKQQRDEHQELIHFMNMQCQFKACPCRMAERNGVRFVHDYEYDQKVRALNAKKRKIDDKPPQPKHVSLKQKIETRQGNQNIRPDLDREPLPEAVSQPMDLDSNELQADQPVEDTTGTASEPAPPLPPSNTISDESLGSVQVEEAMQAAQIPLPPTTEDTAHLEDFTQVMVDHANMAKNPFTSAFASKGPNPVGAAPRAQHLQSTMRLSEELFNLSPPKRAPPRPSTAMGIITTESPLRIVPDSPPPQSASSEAPQMYSQPQITRVALNDASLKHRSNSRHQPQARPNIRDQSRGRSPAAYTMESQPDSTLDLPSPASSTVFPITPVAKHVRNGIVNQSYHQAHHQPFINETTTTTTVPLRGDDDLSEFTVSQNSTASEPTVTSMRDTHGVPGTPVISREAALAQIRARRDRARSVNMRKAEQENRVEHDRKGAKTPGSAARRGVKIDLGHRNGLANQGERGRDVSQASAPGRF